MPHTSLLRYFSTIVRLFSAGTDRVSVALALAVSELFAGEFEVSRVTAVVSVLRTGACASTVLDMEMLMLDEDPDLLLALAGDIERQSMMVCLGG